MTGSKITRGPYLEVAISLPRETTPFVTVRYGGGRSPFASFDEAHAFAQKILRAEKMHQALLAFKQWLDGERDDFDKVIDCLDEALYDL